MTDEERLAHLQQFAERFCADLGLPPPARYTMADLIAHDEALRDGDARVEAMVTRRNRECRVSSGRLRVLDASALIALFHGHPEAIQYLHDAEMGAASVGIPTNAILEAQVVLCSTQSVWDNMVDRRGVFELALGLHAAREAGDLARPRMEFELPHRVLTGPPMVGQVLREALVMRAVIVTSVPEAYNGHDVAVAPL